MTELYPYKAETLGEMFALRKGDIQSLIASEGIPYFSSRRNEFIGYLPSLKSAFSLEDHWVPLCKKNIVKTNYEVSLRESLIRISSKNSVLPANSLLYENLWRAEAEDLLDIDKNFSLLISAREEVPFFCGHYKFINRLADNFAGDTHIVNALEFMNQWQGQSI